MITFRRWLAALACVVVAGASFALSYVALSEVAVNLGAVPAGLGWLVPIVIDGGILCGSSILWSQSKDSGERQLFAYFFVATLVGISVVVNMAHAGDPILAKVIAALPPLILLGTLELVASQGRRLPSEPQSAVAPVVRYGQTRPERTLIPAMAVPVAVDDVQTPAVMSVVPAPAAAACIQEAQMEDIVLGELEQQFQAPSAPRERVSRPRAQETTSSTRRPTRVRAQEADYVQVDS